jgi:hypothetical protein
MSTATKHAPLRRRAASQAAPRVGFVSLGCPKALVDSEQILTQLKAEGYDIAPTYDGADMVVVNTCGFIDAAVAESFAIGRRRENRSCHHVGARTRRSSARRTQGARGDEGPQ